MNKENNRGAAGLRRSAIAERIRLRDEWSALKEIDSPPSRPNNILNKKQNVKASKKLTPVRERRVPVNLPAGRLNRQTNMRSPADALRGVVALVEVGSESRALPLRAALSALGASVMPAWSPLITHLIWAQGGCRSTRARARALASALVSPLWVEACAAASARLPERAFPAAARASDLPSPATLRQMLRKAEADNIPLADLLTESEEKEKIPRLRISSETELDTSQDSSMDISRSTSKDTSRDTSKDTSTDVQTRVNTALRRALPKVSESTSPRVTKSRRKLFTNKEAEMEGSSDDEDENTRPNIPKPKPTKQPRPKQAKPKQAMPKPITPCDRKELARAERMAKRFLAACTGTPLKHAPAQQTPRIVLTGMSRTERREVTAAILELKGRIQRCVNKRTTHVLLGSFHRRDDDDDDDDDGITGIRTLTVEDKSRALLRSEEQARTLRALCGAARGCRVLRARWTQHCAAQHKWLHHSGYEVPHLYKISQKARVERAALMKLRSDYAYDVFCGMRVFVTASAEQRDAAIQLLNLCGAVVLNSGMQNGGKQNGGNQNDRSGRIQHGQGLTQINRLLGNTQKRAQPLTQRTQHALVTQNGEIRYGVVQNSVNEDIRIGVDNGEVSSKWVFDSVAAARMRTTRRYVVRESSIQASQVMEGMANFCIDDC